MKNINNLFAYVAGYIDGDGCFYLGKYIQKPKNIIVYERSIQITSVKENVLREFKSQYGGSIRIKPFKERHRDAFCWTIKNDNSIRLAESIKEFLVEKIYQCELFIQFSKLIMHNKFRTINIDLVNKREKFIESIRKEKHMANLITRDEIENAKKESLTVTPCESDFSYFAGLIDSEGCFRIRKWKPKNKPNHVYCIGIEIGNTKLPIIPWLMKRFGGGISFIEAKNNKRASATWNLSSNALYKILSKIRPYLRNKQEICDKLIEFQETMIPNGGDRNSALFKAMFEKRREVRERIVQEVHNFNHKGSI